MIREITEADIGPLVKYGEFFWTKTPYVTTGMEYNPGGVAALLHELRENHYLRVYEEDDKIIGFIGFLIVPMTFNPNYTVGQEVFFFVHPGHRGGIGEELLVQAEADLKDECDMLAMSEMRSSKDMEEYYAQHGYVLTERVFSKVV